MINLPDMQAGYVALLEYVRANGHYSSPRGIPTIELEDVTFTVEDLEDTLPTRVGRRPNLVIAALEALQLIAGVSTPKLISAQSEFYGSLRESDGSFWGAYGPRVYAQYGQVLRKLRGAPDTRQAVITLWSPLLDNEEGRKDYPCTIAFGFRIRNDRLNMSTVMRSNDLWLGTCYDVFQFTQLQHTLARLLEVEVGTYSHTAWSLHIYERDLEKIDELDPRVTGQQFIPTGVQDFETARKLLDREAEDMVEDYANERWYHNLVMQAYGKMNRHGTT